MSATVTLLKSDGIFVYEDYTKEKVALRLKELLLDVYHPIRRTSNGGVVAYLVSKNWYDTQVAAFLAAPAPIFESVMLEITDDFLASNLSVLIDLVNGKAQIPELTSKVANEGFTADHLKLFKVIDTKGFQEVYNETDLAVGQPVIGGNAEAYLINPKYFTYLSTVVPVATTYAGVGNGALSDVFGHPGNTLSETITLTCIAAVPNGGTFSVVGSVSGALANANVGVMYDSSVVSFLINDGAADFLAGDAFVITMIAM